MISPGNISQRSKWWTSCLCLKLVHNLTVIIHTQAFWAFPQPYYHTAISFQQQLLLYYILSTSLFIRVLSLLFCTAFWTERWVNSNPSSLRCLLSFYVTKSNFHSTSCVSCPLNTPSSSCLSTPSSLLQVQAEIKRKWRRWMLQRFLGAGTKYQQPSIGSNGNNFSTQISMLTKCSPTTRRASECQEHLSTIWNPSTVRFLSLGGDCTHMHCCNAV